MAMIPAFQARIIEFLVKRAGGPGSNTVTTFGTFKRNRPKVPVGAFFLFYHILYIVHLFYVEYVMSILFQCSE